MTYHGTAPFAFTPSGTHLSIPGSTAGRSPLGSTAGRRRAVSVIGLAAVLVGAMSVAVSGPAQSVEAPVAFSAVDLPTWQTNGVAWTVAGATDRAFVGGTFTQVRPPNTATGDSASLARTNFVVLDPSTGEPLPCAPAFERPGAAAEATVRATAVSPDGRTLYVGGIFTRAGGVTVTNLAALDIATCTVSTTFRPLVDGQVRALAVTGTRVYLGGDFVSVADNGRAHAAAVDAVGTSTPGRLADSWTASPDGPVEALAVSPDGSNVVLGGSFGRVNGVSGNAVAVVSAGTGAIVKAYPGFIMNHSVVKDIAVDSSGFYLANEGTGTGVFDGRVALDWSTLTQRWRDTCLGATQSLLVWKSALYSASHTHDCSSMGEYPDGARHHLLAQTLNGPTTKLAWFPDTNEGMGEAIGPRDLAVAPTSSAGDHLFVVGEFTTVNGHAQVGITRFAAATDAAPAGLKLSVTSFQAGKVQVAWRSAVDNDNITLTYSLYRDGGTTPIWTTTGKSTFWSRPQITYVDSQPAGTAHSYRVVVTDGVNAVASPTRRKTVASSDSAYATQVLADGAALLWRFDDPAEVLISDSAPSGDNGTLRGAGTFGTGGALPSDASTALTMTGNGSVVYSMRRAPAPTQVSVETWLRTSSRSGGRIIGFGDRYEGRSQYYDRHLYMSDSGQVSWGVSGSTKAVITSRGRYNDGAWHHFVGTLANGRMVLYADGEAVGTATVRDPQTYVGQWRLGDDSLWGWSGAPRSTSLTADWDETAIYPVALSSTQVAAHSAFGPPRSTSTPTPTPTRPGPWPRW